MAEQDLAVALDVKRKMLEKYLKSVNVSKLLLLKELNATLKKQAALAKKEGEPAVEGNEDQLMAPEVEECGVDLLSGLPVELLEMIFRHLKDPKDLLNCCAVSPAFNKILSPTKPVWLFDQVLPVLLRYMGSGGISKCRLVCRTWKNAVDKFLEGAPRATRMHFGTIESLDRFSKDFSGQLVGNPIVTRLVGFSNDNASEDEETAADTTYWARVAKFLASYGKYIWDCSFDLDFYGLDDADDKEKVLEFVRTMGACLLQLPNVKRLTFNGIEETLDFHTQFRRMVEITRELGMDCIPHLRYLSALDLAGAPGYFCNLLYNKYAFQLITLHVTDGDFDHIVHPAVANNDPLELSNLIKLTISIFPNAEWKDLSKLFMIRCPLLKSLWINVGKQGVKFTSILQAVQHLGEGLEHLVINYIDPIDAEVVTQSSTDLRTAALILSFPQLKALQLINVFVSLDFLFCMPSLEYLSIRCSSQFAKYWETEREEETIQVSGFMHRMYESNVWTLLPSLKEIENADHFKCKCCSSNGCYTRKGYENYKKEKMDIEQVEDQVGK